MPPRRAPGSAWGLTLPADDWRERAACRGEDPELFFPIGTSGPALAQVARARAVCARCPVTRDCLAVALDRGEYGIWGGLTEDERRSLVPRMARRVAECGTRAGYMRHRRLGEPACQPCCDANRRYSRQYLIELARRGSA